jgi:hypothetical protein
VRKEIKLELDHLELDAWEWLCEEISKILIGQGVDQFDQPVLKIVVDEAFLDCKVLHSCGFCMMTRVD